MTTITLSKPVTLGEITVTVLTFREPTGRDIARCGVPLSFSGTDVASGKAVPNTEAINKLIADLSGQPDAVANLLSARDWMAAMTVVLGFFGDATPA